MADTEAPVVEAAPAERPDRNNEPIVFDESLLVIVKGKVQQPKQPDHTESRLLIQKLQAKITQLGDRIKEIKGLEEQLRTNSKGVFSGNKDTFNKLKELRDQRGTIIRQKTAIRDELGNCDGARDAIRAEMRSIRDKNRNVNLEKIEQELRDLEFKLTHETLPEQEEKRVQQLVQTLTAARPVAKKYAEYDARLKESDAARQAIISRLKDSDGVIAELDVQIQALNAVIDEAKSKADAHAADLPSLQVEKKENYEMMVTMRAKIDELRKANDLEYQEYIKRDRAYRGWKRAQDRKKWEERQKEREQRDQERSEERSESMGTIVAEPYANDIFTCEQLLGYLRSFTATAEEVKKEEAKPVEVPAGLKPFKRAEVVDEMFSGVPKQKPAAKGGKAAPAPAAKSAEPAKPKVTKLNHTLDMLKVFLQLNVEPPTTTSGIPATIEKVEQRKVEYKQKQEDAKRAPPPRPAAAANGKHEAKEEEPAASSPAADEASTSAAAAAPAEEEPAAPAPTPAEAVKEAEAAAPSKAEPEPAAAAAAPAAEKASGKKAKKAEKAAAAAAPAGGVGVSITVNGDSVSLSVQAA